MMNRATHEVLVALQNADAEYYMQRDVTQASADRLFGYQIVINETMDDIPATTGDAAPILFGDFAKSFQIIDRVGMSMLQNPYSQMGAISFYSRARVGSIKLNAETLKVVSVSKA
jgi:HK97 family phage major capsid protein